MDQPNLFGGAESNDDLEIVVGEVARITYQDEASGFIVGAVQARDGATEVRFVGRDLPGIQVGAGVRLEGTWKVDPKHGRQFEVRSVRSALPITPEAVLRYIVHNVRGCGQTRAARVISTLGPNCLEILASDPARIAEVFPKGKTRESQEKAWRAWAERFEEDRATEQVYLRLLGTGAITMALARRIIRHFGPREAPRVVLQRPYDLCEVTGVGFKTADAIARSMGVRMDDPIRVATGVVYVLEDAMGFGHSALPPRALKRKALDALELTDPSLVDEALNSNLRAGTLIMHGDLVFTRAVDSTERRVADAVRILAARSESLSPERLQTIEAELARGTLSSAQADAVLRALQSGIFVLTGRPGAGKTTTVRSFLQCCELVGVGERDIAVAAPTGKAASRAAEVTGRPAMTVHRLIGVRFGEVRKVPLPHRWIVLDEVSMCDLSLFDWLLRNVDLRRTSILLVGDVNQLPSVGHGQVLADLIESGVVQTAMLTQVFRQSQESRIKVNANRILDGEPLDLVNRPNSDFLFADITSEPPLGPDGWPIEDPDQSRRECGLGQGRLSDAIAYLKREGANPVRDIQVLTPMRKGILGVYEINRLLQDLLNPRGLVGPRIGDGNDVRQGDRVIQIKNDYQLGVFNGDQGEVIEVNRAQRSIRVRFYEQELEVSGDALSNLHLSWAITVHRSQGSEFPFCILLYHTSQYVMLSRRLLYTAITRAKSRFILIGNRMALDHTLKRSMNHEVRHTGLAVRLSAGSAVQQEVFV